jgi:hypothetical protein
MNAKRVWAVLTLAIVVLYLLGCAAASPATKAGTSAPAVAVEREYVSQPADAKSDGTQLGTGEAGLPSVNAQERKIIYNVSLDLIVRDTEATTDEIERLTLEMGGFIAQSTLWREDGHPRGSIVVRVPVEKLDDAVAAFSELAVDVESKNVNSQDVTEEYVDLDARLRNEQRTEAELLKLLETRSQTGKTEDILEVHRELSQVRAQIEQIQGRMRYLDNLSAMATVTISLTPDVLVQPIVVAGWQPQGTARNAIRMLLRTLQVLADAAMYIVLLILPILIVIAIPLVILFLIGRAIWRRARRRGKKPEQAA